MSKKFKFGLLSFAVATITVFVLSGCGGGGGGGDGGGDGGDYMDFSLDLQAIRNEAVNFTLDKTPITASNAKVILQLDLSLDDESVFSDLLETTSVLTASPSSADDAPPTLIKLDASTHTTTQNCPLSGVRTIKSYTYASVDFENIKKYNNCKLTAADTLNGTTEFEYLATYERRYSGDIRTTNNSYRTKWTQKNDYIYSLSVIPAVTARYSITSYTIGETTYIKALSAASRTEGDTFNAQGSYAFSHGSQKTAFAFDITGKNSSGCSAYSGIITYTGSSGTLRADYQPYSWPSYVKIQLDGTYIFQGSCDEFYIWLAS
ncbi:hypothetical protein FACS1894103_5990 [Campylobacterota bacterium]|nr:hypothetical protein FACS1894103_5990 [Campylobacterota bacterium]